VKPYYEHAGITIYHGDCEHVLLDLALDVDLFLTDPPYNVSHRNGRDGTTVGRVPRKHITGERPDGSESFREIRRDFGEWDYNFSPEKFLWNAFRLLRDGGSLIAFCSEFTLQGYLQSSLDHRCMIYWRKNNPAPNFRGLYQRAVEMAVWQTKGGKWTFNDGGATPNISDCAIVSGWKCENTDEARDHPTQKPMALLAEWMLRHSNERNLVVDPFMGSGTTLAIAKKLGRRAIGIEIEEKYCEIAAKWLSQEVFEFK